MFEANGAPHSQLSRRHLLRLKMVSKFTWKPDQLGSATNKESRPYTRALVSPTPTTTSEGATRRAKVRSTTYVCGLANLRLVPRAATTMRWALRGRSLVARARPCLARTVRLLAIRTLPTMLGVAPALACASGWIQASPIRTCSHTSASKPVPDLHGRILTDAAITVYRCLPERLRDLIVLVKVYVCQEL